MLKQKEESAVPLDLVIIDPPFLTGNSYRARIGRDEDSRKPEEWKTIEGYTDRWEDGADYLNMLWPRLNQIQELLSARGSIYLHLDWHASAHARLLMDEIFGPDRLINEISWVYHGPSPIRSAFNRKHDTILLFAKTDDYIFHADAVRVPYSDSTKKTFASSNKAGFGRRPNLDRGKVPEDWWYFPVVARLHTERTGFPTQKPEALVERMILASSDNGSLVADYFCGSGTVPLVSSRLGRNWLACDVDTFAIATSYRRLLAAGVDSFSLWRQKEFKLAEGISPICSIDLNSRRIRLLDIEGSQAPQDFPENVVLWEVDPRYEGDAFHSQYQVVRPFHGRADGFELDLPVPSLTEAAAVRVFDSLGATGITQVRQA
jgi:DNA modification methylase